MTASLTCLKCNKVIRVGNGRIDLTCQSCGGYDFRLGSSIIVSPALPGGKMGPREEFGIDSSFTGKHKDGSSWLVEVMKEKKSNVEEIVGIKEEESLKEEKDDIKLSFARSVRKLRARVNP